MRVYHFLNEQYGLAAISNQTLKVSRLKSLNDPFEYYHIDTDNYGTRSVLKGRLNKTNKELGLICFSRNYTNPVQWAHYGDSHRGICLGFDIPDENLFEIEYIKQRTSALEFKSSLDLKGHDYIRYMLSKKHEHWQYEEEVRSIVSFPEKVLDDRLIFQPFNVNLSLREVILGVRCSTNIKEIKKNLAVNKIEAQVNKLQISTTEYAVKIPQLL